MLDKLTGATFAPHLHEVFMVSPAPWGEPFDPEQHGPLVALELIENEELSGSRAAGMRAFSLVFSGPGSNLSQRMYDIEHPTLGRLEFFLVPIGPGLYQAIFN